MAPSMLRCCAGSVLLCAALVLVLPYATQAAAKPKSTPKCTFVDVCLKNGASAFVVAAQNAGLIPMLCDPKLQATVMVPNNKAFKEISDLELEGEDLVDVLKYHVLPGVSHPPPKMIGKPMLTLFDEVQQITFVKVNRFKYGCDETGSVLKQSIKAGRARIHIINKVLFPCYEDPEDVHHPTPCVHCTQPDPSPIPHPKPCVRCQPVPVPVPSPVPHPVPVPCTHCQPVPVPVPSPVPHPVPVPCTHCQPVPVPSPVPSPIPQPVPCVHCQPQCKMNDQVLADEQLFQALRLIQQANLVPLLNGFSGTVFLPSDKAVLLAKSMPALAPYFADTASLVRLLINHFTLPAGFFQYLTGGSLGAVFPTLLPGQSLVVTDASTTFSIKGAGNPLGVPVARPNVRSCFLMIHVVDFIILPSLPTPAPAPVPVPSPTPSPVVDLSGVVPSVKVVLLRPGLVFMNYFITLRNIAFANVITSPTVATMFIPSDTAILAWLNGRTLDKVTDAEIDALLRTHFVPNTGLQTFRLEDEARAGRPILTSSNNNVLVSTVPGATMVSLSADSSKRARIMDSVNAQSTFVVCHIVDKVLVL